MPAGSWWGHVPLASILAAVSAGCIGVGPQQLSESANPSDWSAPRWHAGYHWEYRSDEGRWENWTVEAADTYNNSAAYRVRVLLSHPDDWGETSSLQWVEQASLGLMAIIQGSVRGNVTPPSFQLFPMWERHYNSSAHFRAGGYPFDVDIWSHYVVHGWEDFSTPSGINRAVKLEVTDPRLGGTTVKWYSPEARNVVAWETDSSSGEGMDMYRLASWGTKPAKAAP